MKKEKKIHIAREAKAEGSARKRLRRDGYPQPEGDIKNAGDQIDHQTQDLFEPGTTPINRMPRPEMMRTIPTSTMAMVVTPPEISH
jgi:hypothetical protein